MKKITKVTIERDLAITCLTYSQLYIEQRIITCKLAGRDYTEYEQELAQVMELIKSL